METTFIPEQGTTDASKTISYYNYQSPMAEGWLCPRCKRVNSPMMMQCNCPAQAASETRTTDKIFISGIANYAVQGGVLVSGSATNAEDVQISLTD